MEILPRPANLEDLTGEGRISRNAFARGSCDDQGRFFERDRKRKLEASLSSSSTNMVSLTMRKGFLWCLAVVLLVAAVSPAGALGRTSVLTTSRCNPDCSELVGVYKVRPRHIVLYDAYGGGLTLHWSHWRERSATGTGTSFSAGAGGHSTARQGVPRKMGGGRIHAHAYPVHARQGLFGNGSGQRRSEQHGGPPGNV
jgi:hypothetical protein